MWDYATRYGRPLHGELVYAGRFLVDAEVDQRPSQTINVVTAYSTRTWLSQRSAAWDFIGAFTDPHVWEPFMSHIDFHHAAVADYEVGGRAYGVFAHDWRRVGIPEWLELTNDRVVEPGIARPTPPEPELVLSQPEFADAVRSALRELGRGGNLDGNPLLRSRVVRTGQRPATGAALRDLLVTIIGGLGEDPRAGRLHRVLDRTYLRPAPHAGTRRRNPRSAVLHLPPPPGPGARPGERADVEARTVRTVGCAVPNGGSAATWCARGRSRIRRVGG
ncbi:hypothetical protein [Nocardia rhizosphaerae]|uniref:Uncharacterized protein n=1 Tax=Nocardia rhizosphaerae TaxID=1691571 RepID=A0ABV8LAP5_9NOCA